MALERAEVLIIGGGPAGSSCAWHLHRAGVDTLVLDRAVFPRHKTCAGWITPGVLQTLQIDPHDYASDGRVFQPITSFLTAQMPAAATRTEYSSVVSYGSRRCEFDTYLLARSGARVFDGVAAFTSERHDGMWIVNRRFAARVLIGAGGHFCPVARLV